MNGVAIISAIVCLAVSFAAVPAVAILLHRFGVLDVPNERSSHTKPVVRGGGLAPLVGLIVAYIVLLVISPSLYDSGILWAVVTATILAALLGLIEDIVGIPVIIRASLQLLIGLVVAVPTVLLLGLPIWLAVIGCVLVAGYINVANFMDGINGISGLHGILAGAAYAILGALSDLPWMIVAGSLVAAAFAGFLVWNLRGRVFLGDVGSYLLGGSVAAIAVCAAFQGVSIVALMGPVAIYLADSGTTLVRRVLAGERWYEAHRSHTYQRMTDLNLSHLQVASIVAVASAVTTTIGLLAVNSRAMWSVVPLGGLAIVAVIYLSLPRLLARRGTEISIAAAQPENIPRDQFESSLASREANVGSEKWAVVGATGFIGTVIADTLASNGIAIVRVRAPRLSLIPETAPGDVVSATQTMHREISALQSQLSGCAVVVNAAGMAKPDSTESSDLFGANALLPIVIARAAEASGATRLIHLSSAAVQGRTRMLDETEHVAPFSAYSRSKALGEQALSALRNTLPAFEAVSLRATSVQGESRETTINLVKLARSRIASVASPGDYVSPVSSAQALADFVIAIGRHRQAVPQIVLQPWEGMTVRTVLSAAGGKEPLVLPALFCKLVLGCGYTVSRILGGRLSGYVRRVEMMWFGQDQTCAWADRAGFAPVQRIEVILRRTAVAGTRTDFLINDGHASI